MDYTHLLNTVSIHSSITYSILFFGSFLETIFVLSFFIPGELFFISGSALAGMGYLNIWLVSAVLIIGGILGDSVSFWIGHKYGTGFYKFFEDKPVFKRFITAEKLVTYENYFQTKGDKHAFFARFLGPISWVFPFIAGSFKVKYKRFVRYNIPGVVLGISQFILIGYVGGRLHKSLLHVYYRYTFPIMLLLFVMFITYLFLLRKRALEAKL